MGKRETKRRDAAGPEGPKTFDLPTSAQLTKEMKRTRRRQRRRSRAWNAVCAVLASAALCVLAINTAFPLLRIYGDSMDPTLAAGDVVIAVRSTEPEQGALIGFYFEGSILVKRIVAVEGDWVDMDKEGNVYINGKLLGEPYLWNKSYGAVDIDLPCHVPEGCVFVLGDHRSTSIDSRSAAIGCVAEGNIIGEIVFRVWPLDRIGALR